MNRKSDRSEEPSVSCLLFGWFSNFFLRNSIIDHWWCIDIRLQWYLFQFHFFLSSHFSLGLWKPTSSQSLNKVMNAKSLGQFKATTQPNEQIYSVQKMFSVQHFPLIFSLPLFLPSLFSLFSSFLSHPLHALIKVA